MNVLNDVKIGSTMMKTCIECAGSGSLLVKVRPLIFADCPYLLGVWNHTVPREG